MSLKPQAWKILTWRDGTNAPLSERFAAVRVRPAHRYHVLSKPHPRELCGRGLLHLENKAVLGISD